MLRSLDGSSKYVLFMSRGSASSPGLYSNHYLGPAAHASGSFSYRRTSVRRPGPQNARDRATATGIRGRCHLRQGHLYDCADRRRHSNRHDTIDNFHRPGHSVRDSSSQVSSNSTGSCGHRRHCRWLVSPAPTSRGSGISNRFYHLILNTGSVLWVPVA